jgi:hypothetical protein
VIPKSFTSTNQVSLKPKKQEAEEIFKYLTKTAELVSFIKWGPFGIV